MAPEPQSTPEELIAALHEVGEYRETMTSRAAGVIWMIWGLAFAGIGLFNLVFFLGRPGDGAWPQDLSIVVFGAIGALATNAVWRSHALQRDARHAAWIAWVAGIGIPMTLGGLVFLTNALAPGGLREPAFMLAPVLLLGATGALTITLLQRHRVLPAPGFVASGLLFGLFVLARFAPIARTDVLDTAGNALLSIVNLAVFAAVGLVLIRRG